MEIARGSWTGREILFLYVIMLLCTVNTFESGDFLKRNRIICPVVAVNGKFLYG